jgi:hypothetical protein
MTISTEHLLRHKRVIDYIHVLHVTEPIAI